MKKSALFLLSILVLLAMACKKDNDGPQNPKPLTLPPKGAELIQQGNSFGLELFKATASGEDGNMMLSPLSASVALTMLLNGSEAETYQQIRDMLGFEGLSTGEINAAYNSLLMQLLSADPEVKLSLANAVWTRNDFHVRQPFLDTISTAFSAHIEALDFSDLQSLDIMNGWASDNTYGRIDKVLSEISPLAVMFLMNAVYFKGTWTYTFDDDLTAPGPFLLDDGTQGEALLMHGEFPAKTHLAADYQAIELPYGRQNFAMVILVPAGTVASFLPGFGGDDWIQLVDALDGQSTPSMTTVTMPKFGFEYEKELNDQLKSLGMTDAFYPEMADLSGIADDDIYVSFVKQNTFVEVNEEGTEAAAVTTIGIELTSSDLPSFIINKPFIFIIRERTTNTMMFIGKVNLPNN